MIATAAQGDEGLQARSIRVAGDAIGEWSQSVATTLRTGQVMALIFANFRLDGRQFDDLMTGRPGIAARQLRLTMLTGFRDTGDRWCAEVFGWKQAGIGRGMLGLATPVTAGRFRAVFWRRYIGRIARWRHRGVTAVAAVAFPLLSQLLVGTAQSLANFAEFLLKLADEGVAFLAAGTARVGRDLDVDSSRLGAGHEPSPRCPGERKLETAKVLKNKKCIAEESSDLSATQW